MVISRKGIILILSITAVGGILWAATTFYPTLFLKPSRVTTSLLPKQVLEPNGDRLIDAYMNPELLQSFDYSETPYPSTFAHDGLGSLDTKPFCALFHEPLAGWLPRWLNERYPALERNPKDVKALGEIVGILATRGFFSRVVPFADRYRAAGGTLTLKETIAYVSGLTRLGRDKEADQLYIAARKQWSNRATAVLSAHYCKDLFLRRWVVDRSLNGMLHAFQLGMSNGLTEPDKYYVQEVLLENLKRASGRKELEWFFPRMERHWIWFTEDRLQSAVELGKAQNLPLPEALVAATDPLFRGAKVHPRAFQLRAIASMDRGESERALRQSEQAVEFAKELDLREQIDAAINLARILRTREDLERAFQATDQVERLARALGAEEDIGWSLILKGFMCERLGNYRQAAEHFAKALDIGARSHDEELSTSARRYQARALSQAGFAAEVEPFLRKDAESCRAHNIVSALPVTYQAWGICLSRMGRYDDAIAAFRIAVDHTRNVVGEGFSVERTIVLKCLLETAYAHLENRAYLSAQEAFTQYAALAKASSVSTAAWPWQLGLARTRYGLGDKAGAAAMIEECLKSIEAQRASLKDYQQRRSHNDNKYGAYALAIQLAIDQGEPDRAFLIAERSRARTFLDELGTSAVEGRTPQPIDLEVVKVATGDVAVVSYFQLMDRLLAWVVRKGKADLVVFKDVSPERLRNAVAEMLGAALMERVPGASSSRSPALTSAGKLHDLIWKPLIPTLGDAGRVCIVPHGVLHYVPFQALHDGTSYLVEQRELFYTPSASALLELRVRPRSFSQTFVGIEAALSDDPTSPFAKTETLALRAQHPDGRFLMPKEVSPAAFKLHAVEGGIVHLSCHGFFNPWIPIESGLILGPQAEARDSMLTAREIYGMKFNRTGLVVMSACVSSVGDYTGGDEVTGLTRAFQVAGVPNVIGSLWPVENAATTRLMTDFHLRLSERADPISALCAAQRNMIKERQAIALWGAFMVTGDGLPIQMR